MANSGKSRIAAARSARLQSAVTVARYSRHEDAQSAVNLLGERGFPVQALSIVGTGLRQVEHVVAPLTYPRVALAGAAQGLFFGILMGLLMLMFSGDSPLSAFGTAVPLGVALWMIMAVVSFNRNRDANYSAVGTTVASTYDLVCDPREAAEARRLLAGGPVSEPLSGPAEHPVDEAPGSRDATESADRSDRGSRTLATDYQDLEDGRPRYGLREEPAPTNRDAAAEDASDPTAQVSSSHGSDSRGSSSYGSSATDSGAPEDDRTPRGY